jgi:hypothetical protein
MIILFTLLASLTSYSVVVMAWGIFFDDSPTKATTVLSSLQSSIIGVVGMIIALSSFN